MDGFWGIVAGGMTSGSSSLQRAVKARSSSKAVVPTLPDAAMFNSTAKVSGFVRLPVQLPHGVL